MKKFILLMLLIPMVGIGQKTVVSTNRVFPKIDKVLEFEKALAAHAQKYHKGDWAWRVYEVQSGPDVGGFHITEGPTSWEAFDTRGNLGQAHNTDWNKAVAIYLTDRTAAGYSDYNDSLSTVGLSDWSDKIVVNHIIPKPGMIRGVIDIITRLRKVWKEGNESVAVYTTNSSGVPQFVAVTRLKQGLKELAVGFRKPLPERFIAAHGAGSWDVFLQDYAKYIEKRWTEILFYRADLSSK